MATDSELWRCDARPGGPRGFPFAILAHDEIVAWVKTAADAAFIAEAHEQVHCLVVELKELAGPGWMVRDDRRTADRGAR